VVSAEVVRANPGNYMNAIRNQVAESFAIAFDAAALHGTSTPFTTYIDQTASTVEATGTAPAWTAVYDDLNSALNTLVTAGKELTGWAFDSRFEPILNGAKDSSQRPLFVESPFTETAGPVRAGRLLGRQAYIGPGVFASTRRSTATPGTGRRPRGASSAASPTTCRPRPRSRSTARWCRCSRTTWSRSAPRPSTAGWSTTEQAPDLPSQIVTVQRDEPTIDKALIEARNAEAKAQADRLK
jgi:hypothetical protein